MTDFFITGLPRSRTAWLMNLFNTERVLCFHEIMRLYSLEDLRVIFARVRRSYGKEYAGVSEPAPMKVLGIRQIFPDSPIVVIERDEAESVGSMVKAFPFYEGDALGSLKQYIDVNLEAMKRVKGLNRVLAVPYAQLKDLDVVGDIWKFAVPGVPFDKERAQLLSGLNVTVKYGDPQGIVEFLRNQLAVIDRVLDKNAKEDPRFP